MTNATKRFSSRVNDYLRYRPSYPKAVLETLRHQCGLTKASFIADVGSGTGLLSELFLQNGNTVYGIEPNREMREAGENYLRTYQTFKSLGGSAETTPLTEGSVDFITVGQAFHWFDVPKSKVEFQRVLKPQGWVALVWNERQEDSSPFARDYKQLVQTYGTDYQEVNHRRIDESVLQEFFGGAFNLEIFDHQQTFDFEGLKGRLLSSSYTPEVGHPHHAPMLSELRHIFEKHQTNSEVKFAYDTKLYYGRLL
jgi:SAM-dependent methyltransferase